MTSAIARWHSNAWPPSDALELAYADRLEAEMQELAIQLHKVSLLQGLLPCCCRAGWGWGTRMEAQTGTLLRQSRLLFPW